MKHYDYIEWLLYKNKALPEEQLIEMEEHLYNCNICMDIFLSLIDENEINEASMMVSDDFTSRVMNKISETKIKDLRPKKTNSFKIQFGYYVAVASVTIFLTVGGFYTNLVDSVPKITGYMELVEKTKPNIIANFSDNVVNSTSAFLMGIENMEINKEDK